MDLLIWPAAALFILAVLLRSGKRRDGIDWGSRALLLLMSTTICLLFDRWVRTAALNAAEIAATTGVAVSSVAADIRSHYESILLPLYIVIVAIAIDVLARLTRHYVPAGGAPSGRVAFRDVSANLILLVVIPALPFAWAATFADPSSIIGDAARDVLMPIVATYGAPAHWIQVVNNDAWIWQRFAEASWPWNPGYQSDSYLSLYGFLADCTPWMTLAMLMSCIAISRNSDTPPESFIAYFVAPSSASRSLLTRVALGPWRGRVAVAFTALWIVPLILWLSFVVVTLSLSYILIGLAVLTVLASIAGAIVLVFK